MIMHLQLQLQSWLLCLTCAHCELALLHSALTMSVLDMQQLACRHSLVDELRILLLHGVLHLLEFDHEADEEGAAAMAAAERDIMQQLGWQVWYTACGGCVSYASLTWWLLLLNSRSCSAGHQADVSTIHHSWTVTAVILHLALQGMGQVSQDAGHLCQLEAACCSLCAEGLVCRAAGQRADQCS